jgi:RimJ/RimL family protein N-acetyltransferase
MAWRPGEILRIETERFSLRSLTPVDVTASYIKWWNDPEIQDGLNMPPRGWKKEHAVKHISNFDNITRFHLVIVCKEQKRMIGFYTMFVDPRTKVAKSNIVIGEKDYWGKNVVQEVRARMLSFLFNDLGMEKVKGEISGRNLPSIFNYKAQGFTCEGILRSEMQHYKEKEGRADKYLFGLLRDEWLAQQAKAEGEQE